MIKKKAPKKPRLPGENLDLPRVYAVRLADGTVSEAHGQPDRETVLRGAPGGQAFLMGTNEDLKQAEKRLGWATPQQKAVADESAWTPQEQGEYGASP